MVEMMAPLGERLMWMGLGVLQFAGTQYILRLSRVLRIWQCWWSKPLLLALCFMWTSVLLQIGEAFVMINYVLTHPTR